MSGEVAKAVMFVGTSSSVGKSILATALCRILAQDGYRVAPFKAQNMSLNSAVTPSGREIGRAQAVQAEAAGILANEHMNPVLLKPTAGRTQVIVQGRVWDTLSAKEYFLAGKDRLWPYVVESYEFLSSRWDVVVLEGAGSPVEMNLKSRDIANMRAAELANAAVFLVTDIDRGGIFAAIVGTLQLLTPAERNLVKGIVVNKFRGDKELFVEGVRMLESYTGLPVVGVIPHLGDLGIDEEDSVGLDNPRYRLPQGQEEIRVAILQLPHLANFTDLDPLFLEPGVAPYFATEPAQLAGADGIILPGTKSTMADLEWLFAKGWQKEILRLVANRKHVLGICGGYQMLGHVVQDPHHQESQWDERAGLDLFPALTGILPEKRTVLSEGVLQGPFSGLKVKGYEIHMGETTLIGPDAPLPFAVLRKEVAAQSRSDGAISSDGRIIGTYLHGILHNDAFRTAWLNEIRREKGQSPQPVRVLTAQVRTQAYDRLATAVRSHLNMDLFYQLSGFN
ncbi:cobyric acid synthase [Alicyclobacillaceae bacterium I2511]|nr:cobyric acid synthase [Alicyclobacillaceae bacterium I2511]